MDSIKLPPVDRLRQLLDYDPVNGIFKWKVWRRWNAEIGSVAGYVNSKGYLHISIDGREYKAHRIAWKYFYGEEPVDQIDHIDGDRKNNKISNLRQANNRQNQMNVKKQKNNTVGLKGVYFNKKSNKWVARIGVNYKRIFLGLFDTPEKAHDAYKDAAKKYIGEYARFE